MTFTMFLGLIGGLALFLYGMELLGTQLRILSGSRLEALLRKLTSNRLKAVMLGLAVTAVIQSSSATTVMVVGFVNSGIMQLQQTVGIIMGANIGTTVTAWILSLTGLSGDSFIVTLLKPSTFVPILAAVGIVLVMIHRRDRTKDIGLTLLGFALLMYGMEMMSAAMNPLSDNPAFTSLMVRFRNPILGVAAGAILTAIIQSSSASVGILQALALTGNMSYAACLPIILGQNIGT
ncbi:MAG: Na/Pi symporter, partial [Peptoniphilaceae bacterium]|nr:Na/Pi symporter [Peptoniphilaceae bacterium]